MVAVHGLMMRWFDVDERVVRPLTAFAICSSEFFELFDSSSRRRKSTTWAFNSLICMEQFRSFCACRFWMPITLFSWLKKENGKIIAPLFQTSSISLSLSSIYLSHCCLEFTFHANIIALVWINWTSCGKRFLWRWWWWWWTLLRIREEQIERFWRSDCWKNSIFYHKCWREKGSNASIR